MLLMRPTKISGNTFLLFTKTPTKESRAAARTGGSVPSLHRPLLVRCRQAAPFAIITDRIWIAEVAARAMIRTRRRGHTTADTTSTRWRWMKTFTDREATLMSALPFRSARCIERVVLLLGCPIRRKTGQLTFSVARRLTAMLVGPMSIRHISRRITGEISIRYDMYATA